MANMGIAGECENCNSEYSDGHILHQVLRFFLPMVTRDARNRLAALDAMCEAVLLKAIGGSITLVESSNWTQRGTNRGGGGFYRGFNNGNNYENEDLEDMCPKATLHHYLPTILMHSVMCPFLEVRESFEKLLDKLKNQGIKVPRVITTAPTRFFQDRAAVIHPEIEEQTQQLFIDAFLQNGRLDHITQLMGYHPAYLECFLKTQHFLLRGDGPLPYDYRHYIAIIAAARHQCASLVNLHKQEFLLQGGDPMWLRGLNYIPQKLRDLYEINKILAHRPWLITSSHIKKLTKGSKEGWSLSEVVHAISLLVHFHSLASFVHGCGINSEVDEENGHTFRPPSLSESSGGSDCEASSRGSPIITEIEGGVEALMMRMKTLSEQAQEEKSREEMIKRFQKVESQTLEFGPLTGEDSTLNPKSDVSNFIEDAGFQYQDFAKRGEISDISTFRVQDYSWDDHGFSLVNRLYNDVGTLLDDKFKTAYGLTYNTMGTRKDVDTTTFRRAIWNYIHCIFGIRHDDYDYGEVNQLLDRDLKSFIKTVCCFPERTTKKDYENVMRDFRHSEKVHVNLMMLEARMQGELLYALRAIMWYMT